MEEDAPAELTTEVPAPAEPPAYGEQESDGPLNIGLLILFVVIVGAVAVQNLWLRKKPLEESGANDE